LPARLRERQAVKFVEDGEVLPANIIGKAPRASGSAFGLKLVDLIDNIEESPARAAAEAGTGDRNDQMTLRGIEGDLPPVDPGDGQSQRLAALDGRFYYLLVGSARVSEPLPARETRRGLRTALTFPLLPPPQKN
jgi:hypothetical protein